MKEGTQTTTPPSESGWAVLAKVALFVAVPAALIFLAKLFFNL